MTLNREKLAWDIWMSCHDWFARLPSSSNVAPKSTAIKSLFFQRLISAFFRNRAWEGYGSLNGFFAARPLQHFLSKNEQNDEERSRNSKLSQCKLFYHFFCFKWLGATLDNIRDDKVLLNSKMWRSRIPMLATNRRKSLCTVNVSWNNIL